MFREGDIAKGRKLGMYTLMYIDWGKQGTMGARRVESSVSVCGSEV